MRVTATEEFGLRCLLQVARGAEQSKTITIREIAEKEGLSLDHATKIMMKLRRATLVKSVRGVNGGFTLSKPLNELTLGSVMYALDDYMEHDEKLHCDKFCDKFSGLKEDCVHLDNCSVRPMWITISLYLYGALNRISLKQLLENEQEATKQVRSAFKEYAQSA